MPDQGYKMTEGLEYYRVIEPLCQSCTFRIASVHQKPHAVFEILIGQRHGSADETGAHRLVEQCGFIEAVNPFKLRCEQFVEIRNAVIQ